MLNLAKSTYFRIIAITVAGTLFFERVVYGMELGDVKHLRVPLIYSRKIVFVLVFSVWVRRRCF